ncbi:hypothetical protein [Azospirillum argentinense]
MAPECPANQWRASRPGAVTSPLPWPRWPVKESCSQAATSFA